MITLSADNRSLTVGQKYTYLSDNNASGQSTLVVANPTELSTGDFILVGMFGNPSSEVFRVGNVDTDGSVQLLDTEGNPTTTEQAHSESSRVTILPFNQVRFYWTPATGTIADEDPEFDTTTPISDLLPIDPTEWFTTYSDGDHSTGFGWFLFYNSVTTDFSQNSNAIPYVGFATNSVQYVFDDFLSLINNRELKLVTQTDMFSWLNEGLSLIYNKLNLTNPEYTASAEIALNVVSGSSEYILPSDFGDLIQITTDSGLPINWISLRDAMKYIGDGPRYYIRGRYLGIVPIPSGDVTYKYRYRSKGVRRTSLDDVIDLPDNGANVLKDWMMYRACLKFQNPNAQVYYKGFNDGMNQLIVSSLQRDANLDSWGIIPQALA